MAIKGAFGSRGALRRRLIGSRLAFSAYSRGVALRQLLAARGRAPQRLISTLA